VSARGRRDLYRLRSGKISQEWASEDLTAILNDTGTYKAPWIPDPRLPPDGVVFPLAESAAPSGPERDAVRAASRRGFLNV